MSRDDILNSPLRELNFSLQKCTPTPDKLSYRYEREEKVITPSRKNSVKRNLNTSFGDIQNYSIIDSEDEEPLKIKLRKSSKPTDTPYELRKSSRNTARKSYAEYISPKKSTRRTDCFPPSRSTRSRKVKVPFRYTEEVYVHAGIRNTPTPSRRSRRIMSYCESNFNKSDTDESSSDERNLLPSRAKEQNKNKAAQNLCENNYENDGPKKSPKQGDKSPPKNPMLSPTTQLLKVKLEKLRIKDDEEKTPEDEISLSKPSTSRRKLAKTPVKHRISISDDSSSDNSVERTPRKKIVKKSTRVTPKSQTPKTPRNHLKLIKENIITPSMQSRSHKVKNNDTPLMKARSQLHVSYVPKSLPCREKEYEDVYNFLEGKLLDECSGCMYISGVPGTGKTATVTSVINNLQSKKATPKFTFVNVNAMRLTEPRQAYVEILKQLIGKTVPWEQAHNMLEEILIKSKKFKCVVMLIDELDILCTKRQEVIYNLLDWPTKAKSQLIVITIANTMDLPERLLMSRVTSRLGLTRLTFQAYTFKQLQDIVTKRLCGIHSFNPDAIQYVARKVASVSGDARRALDICRRAAEIAEAENDSQLVSMAHVNEALNAMITQPKVQAIKHCSKLEKYLLQSIVAEVERTGVEETNFLDVYKMLVSITTINGFQMVSTTVALAAVSRLSSCKLILTDQKCNNIHQRVILNVSSDDVYYALREPLQR